MLIIAQTVKSIYVITLTQYILMIVKIAEFSLVRQAHRYFFFKKNYLKDICKRLQKFICTLYLLFYFI